MNHPNTPAARRRNTTTIQYPSSGISTTASVASTAIPSRRTSANATGFVIRCRRSRSLSPSPASGGARGWFGAYFFVPLFLPWLFSLSFPLPPLLWWVTNFTHWPWFLNEGFLKRLQPPFLHCCLLVGAWRT
jgi:hypothetical protein